MLGLSWAGISRGADFNGDGTNDMGVFRPSNGLWALRSLTRVYFGRMDDRAMPGDYDGDGTVDLALYRPSSGLWAVRGITRAYFGGPDDTPLSGIVGGGKSPWRKAGSDLYFNSGQVGIGTSAPGEALDVVGIIKANGGDSGLWNTAYGERHQWDGGSTSLNTVTARASLGLGSLATQDTVNNGDWSGAALTLANGGTGATSAASARTSLGLGLLATQDTVNNGDWSGAALTLANGGTGATSAASARNNLGLGSLATSDTVDNGDWSGAALTVANGGTGASDAVSARASLGLGGGDSPSFNGLTVNDGTLYVDSTQRRVGIGTTSPSEQLEITGNLNLPESSQTAGVVKMNGYYFLYAYGQQNTFLGQQSGNLSLQGEANYGNTALGYYTLPRIVSGGWNTAVGLSALASLTTGGENTVLGDYAGYSNQTGSGNVYIGNEAGRNALGSNQLYIANSRNDPPLIYGDFSRGMVGINTTSPAYALDVHGDINTDGEVRKSGVAYNNPDYVFEPGYQFRSLPELKEFIAREKHLPGMPSTKEVRRGGVKIFEQNRLVLEKLEESYLYILRQNDRISSLEARLAKLEKGAGLRSGEGALSPR